MIKPRIVGLLYATTLLSAGALPAQAAGIEPLRAIAKRGGAIEAGTYLCRQQYNQSGYTEKTIEIVNASTYAYRASQRYPGEMKYDSKSGLMKFSSGKLANGFEAVFGRRENGHPIFILTDTDIAPKADAYDLCVRRADK